MEISDVMSGHDSRGPIRPQQRTCRLAACVALAFPSACSIWQNPIPVGRLKHVRGKPVIHSMGSVSPG